MVVLQQQTVDKAWSISRSDAVYVNHQWMKTVVVDFVEEDEVLCVRAFTDCFLEYDRSNVAWVLRLDTGDI